MKKLTTWMLVLMLVPGLVALTGCKKDEAAEDTGEMAEPMAEATPTPAMEPMMEATPAMEATPGMDGAMDAAATPSPAV